MKVIIAGTRTFNNRKLFKRAIQQLHLATRATEIVSGGAKGADHLGEVFAKDFNIKLTIFEADWALHGKSAGPRRNKKMAEYADMLLAFWDGNSIGTLNMIQQAQANGLEVWIRVY